MVNVSATRHYLHRITGSLSLKRTGAQRGTYSFCMCPGGVVVTTPTEPGALCINGMSHAARSGRFANSAMVVTVTPDDFAQEGFTGGFAGVEFQKECETRAYERGGGNFMAPSLRVTDYMERKISANLPETSYRRVGWFPPHLTKSTPVLWMTHFEKRLRSLTSACLDLSPTRLSSLASKQEPHHRSGSSVMPIP